MAGVANQRAYRWYADGTEADSVALGAANTVVTAAPNTLVLLRLAMDYGSGTFTFSSPRLQVSDQPSTNYVDLGNLGVAGFNGGTTPGGLLHNIACTNRLTGTGSWQAGGNTTTLANGAVNGLALNGGYYINYLFAIQIGNIPGVTRYFRLTHSGGAPTIVNIPQITVSALPPPKLNNTLLSGGLMSPLVNSLGGSL